MKFRSIFLTVITSLMLVLGAGVQAQDDMGFDPCFGLAEADCAVINEASANGLGEAESFTIDVTIDFSGEELQALFGLLGGLTGDPEAGADMGALGELTAATFFVEGTFDVMATTDEEGALSGSFVTRFSQNGGDVTEVAMDIIVVDGIAYMDLGDGWQSVNLDELDDGGTMDGLGLDLGMGDDMDMDDMDDMDDAAADFDLTGLAGIFGILDLPGFLAYERDGDQFDFVINFAVLQQLLEEENEELLNELVITASEIDPSLAFFIPLLPTLISDGAVSISQTVDTDANIVTQQVINANLDLALGILEGSTAVTSVDLAVDLGYSNFDSIEPIVAPDDATDATAEFAAWLESMMPQEAEMEEEMDDESSDG